MLWRTLQSFFLWELKYFIGEKEWLFHVPEGYDAFKAKFSKIIEPTTRNRPNPVFKFGSGLFGFCDPNAVSLTSRSKLSPLWQLFGLSYGYRFNGRFYRNNKGLFLVGRYVPRFYARAASLFGLNFLIFFGAVGLMVGSYETFRTGNPMPFVITVLVVICIFLGMAIARRKATNFPVEYVDKPRREAVYRCLVELTGDEEAGELIP